MRCFRLLILAGAIGLSGGVCAAFAQEAGSIKPGQEGQISIPGTEFTGVLYVPSDYEPGRRFPLLLFMHGSGAKPTSWPWKTATGGKGYFVLGLPYGAQADGAAGGIHSDRATKLGMVKLIDDSRRMLDAAFAIDQKAVILSGLSMGGWGVNYYGFLEEARGRYCGYAILAAGPRSGRGVDFSVTENLPVLLLNGETDANLASANNGKPMLEAAGAVVEQVIIPGEGHVPSVQSMAKPLSEWLAKVEADRRNRSAMAAVQWTELRAPAETPKERGSEALGACLAACAGVKRGDEDRPVLVYGYSTKTKKKGAPTSAAKASLKASASLFTYPKACHVPIASRSFHCCRIDVSNLDRKKHRHLNESMAPFVVLMKKTGEGATLYPKSRLSERSLVKEMSKHLTTEDAGSIESKAKDFRPILSELGKTQKKRASVVKTLAKLRRAKKPKRKAIAAKVNELAAIDETLAEIRGKLAH